MCDDNQDKEEKYKESIGTSGETDFILNIVDALNNSEEELKLEWNDEEMESAYDNKTESASNNPSENDSKSFENEEKGTNPEDQLNIGKSNEVPIKTITQKENDTKNLTETKNFCDHNIEKTIDKPPELVQNHDMMIEQDQINTETGHSKSGMNAQNESEIKNINLEKSDDKDISKLDEVTRYDHDVLEKEDLNICCDDDKHISHSSKDANKKHELNQPDAMIHIPYGDMNLDSDLAMSDSFEAELNTSEPPTNKTSEMDQETAEFAPMILESCSTDIIDADNSNIECSVHNNIKVNDLADCKISSRLENENMISKTLNTNYENKTNSVTMLIEEAVIFEPENKINDDEMTDKSETPYSEADKNPNVSEQINKNVPDETKTTSVVPNIMQRSLNEDEISIKTTELTDKEQTVTDLLSEKDTHILIKENDTPTSQDKMGTKVIDCNNPKEKPEFEILDVTKISCNVIENTHTSINAEEISIEQAEYKCVSKDISEPDLSGITKIASDFIGNSHKSLGDNKIGIKNLELNTITDNKPKVESAKITDITSTAIENSFAPSNEDKSIKLTKSTDTFEKKSEQEPLEKTENISSVIKDTIASTSEIDSEQIVADGNITEEKSNDGMEMADSLGLLAESQRLVEDDEEQDVEDDFEEQEEENNQITGDNSEDSNPERSEAPSDVEMENTADVDLLQKETENVECESANETKTTEQVVADGSDVTENGLKESTDKEVEMEATEPSKEGSQMIAEISEPGITEMDTEETTKPKPITRKRKSMLEHLLASPNRDPPLMSNKRKFDPEKSAENIIDLGESSSEDDVAEAKRKHTQSPVVSVNIPNEVEVMSTSITGSTSNIVAKDGEVVINNLPSPARIKPTRLNTAEVTIKTINAVSKEKEKESLNVDFEVYSLDSDEDDSERKAPSSKNVSGKCINKTCESDDTVALIRANPTAVNYYEATKKKKPMVCEKCSQLLAARSQKLMDRMKSMLPLLLLDDAEPKDELVEISDSESDDEGDPLDSISESIGPHVAEFLQKNLADVMNCTWQKYNMDARLLETQKTLEDELERLTKSSEEVNESLEACQKETDRIRREFYGTFEVRRKELDSLIIPTDGKISLESTKSTNRLDSDDNADVSVVRLSAETAPAGLPPPGELTRPPPRPGMPVYAMKNAFGSWLKAYLVELVAPNQQQTYQSVWKVRFERTKNPYKNLSLRCLAYEKPAEVRMSIGTRVIALFKDENNAKRESFYSGVVAEVPNPVNSYRYLVFFDDGYAQYVQHADTRLVCDCSPLVWEEVHPFSRDFVKQYLLAYPERPMVRLHPGQTIKTEWNGKWWVCKVKKVDASLVQVYFQVDARTEWIYRGSTRLAPLFLELQTAERHRNTRLPRSTGAKPTSKNMPYVEYIREDQTGKKEEMPVATSEDGRKQRAVAKKSTAQSQAAQIQPPTPTPLPAATSRVVYYTPKNAVKPYKMVNHNCSPKCKRVDVLPLKDLRTYNPLAKPLLSGWERHIVRYKGVKAVAYRAPCGRRLRNMPELHKYLCAIQSDMDVGLFDFGPNTHCLAEFVLNKCYVSKKDLSHGKENVPVPCVNYYDDSLPEFCSYNTERTPTAGVPLNLDPEFLCGCDCTDDCQDKSKCACWRMTMEGASTIGLDPHKVGYVYKRLPEPLQTGIYECNSRCKCRQTCLNRVAQHPLQLKLQVFKTLNRGWGIRALNDVPKGSFLCVYVGNLLTDATANLDGLNEGDEYLAELDYIEVAEQTKEGYEANVRDEDKRSGKSDSEYETEDETQSEAERAESDGRRQAEDDDDFRPGYRPSRRERDGNTTISNRLRRRKKNEKDKSAPDKGNSMSKESKGRTGDDCITISDDDDEVREPSRFTVQEGMSNEPIISKHKSVRALFGRDEACYIMDAKVQGNIGRYLNHSCTPNVFVQNVFVDTHDPRFPWVAFFAHRHIPAGAELTWNYNYDVGSVAGKVLYCYCGAANCRGRLL